MKRRGLTPREVQVLLLLATGKTNPEIGENLNIRPQTVKNHVAAIYRKMGTRNRVETAIKAFKEGW